MSEQHEIKFKIVRTNPDNLRYKFSNDVIITHDKQNFYLQFGQIAPPQITGREELENITLLGSIESQAVSRIVFDKAYLPVLIRALEDNLKKLKSIERNQGNQREISEPA